MLVSKAFKQMRQNPKGTAAVTTAPIWTFVEGAARISRGSVFTCYALATDANPISDATFVDMLQTPLTYDRVTTELKKTVGATVTGTYHGRAGIVRGTVGLMVNIRQMANERINSPVPISNVYLFLYPNNVLTNLGSVEAQLVVRLDIEDLKYLYDLPDLVGERLDISTRPLRISHLKLS